MCLSINVKLMLNIYINVKDILNVLTFVKN